MNELLRRATIDDVPQLLAFMRDFNALEDIRVPEERLRPALAALLGDEALGRVWLVRDAGRSIGHAVMTFGYDLEFAGRDAFITELHLVADVRGRGLGRRVLAAIEAEAKALDVHAIHLMVRPENARAVALYARAGYASPPRVFLSKEL